MRPQASAWLSVPVMLLGLSTSQAHHASAGLYERDQEATVRGTVTSLRWRNPHVRFELQVINDEGVEEIWEIEGGSINTLERIGIGQELLAPGNVIAATGPPGRNGRHIMFASHMESADGEELALNPPQTERYNIADRSPAADIFRVWVPFTRPETGEGFSEFPLNDAGRAMRDAWDPESDLALQCIPPGMPVAMDNPYPVDFEDRGDRIIMRLEEWDGVRTFYMDAEVARTNAQPSPMGHSVARWDGDDLVVETSMISYPFLDDLGAPQSDQSRMVERFSIDREGGVLNWTAEITDPEYLSGPLRQEISWEYIPGNIIKAFNCSVSGD